MKNVLFLIPAIIAMAFVTQNANAIIQIDPASIYYNDNGNYVPYKLIQNTTSSTIFTKDASYVFNKNTCAVNVYNPTGSLIGGLSSNVLASLGNSGVWNGVSVINNAQCTPSIIQNGNTFSIIGTKSVAGAGTFIVNYTKQFGHPIKLTYSATNSNPAWTNYHIGLADTLPVNRFTTLGNQTFDLAQYNNTVLTRTWISSHHAQFLQFANNLNYDMGIGWNHVNDITVHWINNQASITIDYTFNTPILSPGNTITIDPSLDVIGTAIAVHNAASPQHLSITVGSNNHRILVVGISNAFGSADPSTVKITSVKIGSTSFTLAVNDTRKVPAVTAVVSTEFWYLLNPPTGSNTIDITFPSVSEMTANVYSLYNVTRTSPIGVTTTNSTTSTITSSISITPTHTKAWILEALTGNDFAGGQSGANSANSDTLGWSSIVPASTVTGSSQYNSSPSIGSANLLKWGNLHRTTTVTTTDIAMELKSDSIPPTP